MYRNSGKDVLLCIIIYFLRESDECMGEKSTTKRFSYGSSVVLHVFTRRRRRRRRHTKNSALAFYDCRLWNRETHTRFHSPGRLHVRKENIYFCTENEQPNNESGEQHFIGFKWNYLWTKKIEFSPHRTASSNVPLAKCHIGGPIYLFDLFATLDLNDILPCIVTHTWPKL